MDNPQTLTTLDTQDSGRRQTKHKGGATPIPPKTGCEHMYSQHSRYEEPPLGVTGEGPKHHSFEAQCKWCFRDYDS